MATISLSSRNSLRALTKSAIRSSVGVKVGDMAVGEGCDLL